MGKIGKSVLGKISVSQEQVGVLDRREYLLKLHCFQEQDEQ